MRVGLRKGFSLLETLISLFIIVVALLMMTQLMHSSLRRGTVTQKRLQASLFAQQTLEEIRVWALAPNNFESDWSPYDDQLFIDPSFPGLETRTTLSDKDLASPSDLLEQDYPLVEQRALPLACKGVTVECSWGTATSQRVELVSLVAAPPRAFRSTNPIEITPSGSSVAKDSTETFTARAFDDTGQEIKGITFSWYIVPKAGNATMVGQTRDGREGTLGHWLIGLDGVTRVYAPGSCDFVAQARYDGVFATGSTEVDLE
jgi:prepilin-type N-terminal cleavage/methylation domain-containing protein